MSKIKHIFSRLRKSFWFPPALIVAFSIGFALVLIEVDSSGSQDWMAEWPRIFGANAAGSRDMLSAIAGSMMTVVGVTFSMTLVTLTLASSQYTSRILRNFMSDHATQIVLGIFAGIFTYCIIVLRTIRGGDDGGFVPGLAVAFSVVLAIGGIGTLIYFIHHIASSIQASSIIASVTEETLESVDKVFPRTPNPDEMAGGLNAFLLAIPEGNWHTVAARDNGYVQRMDDAALMGLACEHKTIVRMERGIGEFVVRDTSLVSIALGHQPDKALSSALAAAFSIDRYRTVEQDCAFGIRQLVDMALRALSPGVNDSTTAVMCVEHLTAILARVAGRASSPEVRYEDGELRLITIRQTFADLVASSFDEIRVSAEGNSAIMLCMLEALQTIAGFTSRPGRRRVLLEQAGFIGESAGRTIESPHDRGRVESRLARTLEGMNANALSPEEPGAGG